MRLQFYRRLLQGQRMIAEYAAAALHSALPREQVRNGSAASTAPKAKKFL